jgi:hypothetical protein
LQYSTLFFEARDVMSFLGRKLNGNFQEDLVTEQLDFSQLPRRLPGRWVEHRRKRNWIKMYNQEGSVLRVETVIPHSRRCAFSSPADASSPRRKNLSVPRPLRSRRRNNRMASQPTTRYAVHNRPEDMAMRALVCAALVGTALLGGCRGNSAQQQFETAQFEELQQNREHARQLYAAIIRDAPDSEYAAKARERLAALDKEK